LLTLSLTNPEVELYRKSRQLFDFSALGKDSEGNDREEIVIEDFKMAICHIKMLNMKRISRINADEG